MTKRSSSMLSAIRFGLLIMCLGLFCVAMACNNEVEDNIAAEQSQTTTVTTTTTTTQTTTTTTTEYREEVVLEHPYLIQVDKTAQVVSVFTTNEEGKYEKLVRQMICSTGIEPQKFRDGMYELSGLRYEWRTMLSHNRPMYAQYSTVIYRHFMFHAVPCSLNGYNNSLYENEYKKLGTACSGGCIRLTVEGAKWIFENCPEGTPVCVMTGEVYDEELIESLRPPEPENGWDPTDPHPDNPNYHPMITTADPEPDKYAPLYDYDWEWGPSYNTTLTGTRVKTTTSAVTTGTAPTNATTHADQTESQD